MAGSGAGKQVPGHITHPHADQVIVHEKRRKAAELRREGKSWDDIAAEVGYADRATAYNAVKQLMIHARDLSYGEAELYRQESLDRLMALYQVAWPLAKTGNEKHMIVCLRIIKQMGDLRGENLPIKVQIGEGDVDRALRELNDELNRRAAAAAEGQAGRSPAPSSGDS